MGVIETQLGLALYVLSPTFIYASFVLTTILLLSLVSLIINGITYTRLAALHLSIFVLTYIFIPTIPITISADILFPLFLFLSTIKSIGGAFSMMGNSEHLVERIVFVMLSIWGFCILVDAIIHGGQRSVVVYFLAHMKETAGWGTGTLLLATVIGGLVFVLTGCNVIVLGPIILWITHTIEVIVCGILKIIGAVFHGLGHLNKNDNRGE